MSICLGVHYWYDNRLDLNCDEIFPAFLLYNKGKLTGFGWTLIGKFEYSKRTEFPPLTAVMVLTFDINIFFNYQSITFFLL